MRECLPLRRAAILSRSMSLKISPASFLRGLLLGQGFDKMSMFFPRRKVAETQRSGRQSTEPVAEVSSVDLRAAEEFA